MINQYHKSATNYDKMVKEFGEKIIDINSKLDEPNTDVKEAEKEDKSEEPRNLKYDLNRDMMQHFVVAEESSSQSYSLRS